MTVADAPVEAGREAHGARRRPRRSRYLLVVPLLLLGLVFAAGVGLGGGTATSDRAQGFARVLVPGSLTLRVPHPGSYVVYSEGTVCLDYPNCHGQLYPVTVRVAGPSGSVPVHASNGPSYMIGGTEGTGVAVFEATSAGDYTVSASTGSYAQGQIAVGEAFPWWTGGWVSWMAMAVVWAIALLIVVVPVALERRREHSRATT